MNTTSSPGRRCPICGKPSQRDTRPFCSRRCADIDLGRWLKGTYRVPTDEAPGLEGGPDGVPGRDPNRDDA